MQQTRVNSRFPSHPTAISNFRRVSKRRTKSTNPARQRAGRQAKAVLVSMSRLRETPRSHTSRRVVDTFPARTMRAGCLRPDASAQTPRTCHGVSYGLALAGLKLQGSGFPRMAKRSCAFSKLPERRMKGDASLKEGRADRQRSGAGDRGLGAGEGPEYTRRCGDSRLGAGGRLACLYPFARWTSKQLCR